MKIPEDVTINYISPGGATTNITQNVLYEDAYFELQAAAVPGSFHITCKDPTRTLSFVAGGRIELYLGAIKLFGGFITTPTRDFFFPALDTHKPVTGRRWSLDGVDYNHLLDKRLLRNPADYTHHIAAVPVGAGDADKAIIATFGSYFDLDFSGGGNIGISGSKVHADNTFSVPWVWPEQGSTMRQVLDALVIETTIHAQKATVYWIDANADINWMALQTTQAQWGFSDTPTPNSNPPYIGWREGSASEDGSSVINEVFIWGGAPIGSNGTVVLAHRLNTDSVNAHGRWQMAEVHPGEEKYKSQAEVNARANALLSGDTSGTAPATGAQGLVNPDLQYVLTWFAHDVPIVGGARQHLVAGNVVNLALWSFGRTVIIGGNPTPIPYSPNYVNEGDPIGLNLPLRQMRISFPTLPSNNPTHASKAYVQFQGTFGLQLADPVWWWAFLRKTRPRVQAPPVVTTTTTSTSFPYGSYFLGGTKEAPDGTRVLFSIVPTYIPGTLVVTKNGGIVPVGSVVETNPAAGSFTFSVAPLGTDVLSVSCRTG